MKFYRLSNQEIDWKHSLDRVFNYMLLPDINCSRCERNLSQYTHAADIPEPVPVEAQRFLKSYISKDISDVRHLNPSEFFEMEKQLRIIYQMDERRLILPRAFLSPTLIRRSAYKPKWDAYLQGSFYVSKRVMNELLYIKATGIEFFPVHYRKGAEADIVEVVVYGDGGVPSLSKGGRWFRCPECKQNLLLADHPVKFLMNPVEWDGSDFFHFSRRGCVYVSERVYTLLHSPRFNIWEWINFDAIDEDWQLPDYPLNID